MTKTKHFRMRQSQRGISDVITTIIEEYGKYSDAPGGATKIHFGKRERQDLLHEIKRFMHLVEKAEDGTIIIINDTYLTTYKEN